MILGKTMEQLIQDFIHKLKEDPITNTYCHGVMQNTSQQTNLVTVFVRRQVYVWVIKEMEQS